MRTISIQSGFPQWRTVARAMLSAGTLPQDIAWSDSPGLLENALPEPSPAETEAVTRVPKKFLQLAEHVAYHREPKRWAILYRVLWRLTHGEHELLNIAVDSDIHKLDQMEKAIRRDAHKMKAFVRFRKIVEETGEHYIAWHRPENPIVRLVAPFFRDRFGIMRWTILTPDEAVTWDGTALQFGPGVPRSAAPDDDDLESLWKTYYGATFNPARIKLKAMRKEMPLRHWATLPETQLIPQLLREAPARVERMDAMARSAPVMSAAPFVPESRSLSVLAKAATKCEGCPLYKPATQVVFGEGSQDAICMFVGEQPGDQEDLAGKAFVGPAGMVLNDALAAAGIDRSAVYVTNAVKHFKFEERGKRRIHSKPSAREVTACRPWLEAEIEAVKPRMIVTLGATAASTLLGSTFRVSHHRGEVLAGQKWSPWMLATIHPSFILRIPDREEAEQTRREFINDLKIVARELARS